MGNDLNLSDRMKMYYENAYRIYLPRRMPCIIRVDGKAFHTFTRGLQKPFDQSFVAAMWNTTLYLCENIQGAKLAYWQSDEISILLTDYDTLQTDAWFGKNVQKMVSVSASMATACFNRQFKALTAAEFDSRVFVIPKEEACNYFIDRQQDATRNSINSVGQANFSHKQLHGLNTDQVQDILFKEKGINWNDIPTWQKRGACVIINNDGQWTIDNNIPIFSQNRDYINKLVYIGEE